MNCCYFLECKIVIFKTEKEEEIDIGANREKGNRHIFDIIQLTYPHVFNIG